MEEIKKQRGITLIALIITIVVLLILAGVVIGTLEENNIIGRTKEATSQYESEKEKENTTTKEIEELLEKYSSNITYADFWKAAYEKFGGAGYAIISNHIYIGVGEIEDGTISGIIYYGDWNVEDENGEVRYIMSMTDFDDYGGYRVEANEWYSATSGSEIDLSTILSLPEEISKNKSGTPVAGYEELCALFDKVIGTEGCDPYIVEKSSQIEYYIASFGTGSEEAGYILKINFEDNTGNMYGYNIEGNNYNYGSGAFTLGDEVTEETIIQVDNGDTTTTAVDVIGAKIIIANNQESGYKKDKKIYMKSGLGYYCYTLVEDSEKIKEIEETEFINK